MFYRVTNAQNCWADENYDDRVFHLVEFKRRNHFETRAEAEEARAHLRFLYPHDDFGISAFFD